MSGITVQSAFSSAENAAPRGEAVRRTPFYLSSRDEPLFAWLHTIRQEAAVDHAVLICPPIGHEQLHAHRSLRHLADALARIGIPTLRFDWHGTGDSAGGDEDPCRTAAWLAGARDAEHWLRSELGCRQVSVVGLRLGALLAAQAFSTSEIANLVLWAPVTSGRAYVRQIQAIDLMSEAGELAPREASADIEAAGFLLTRATADELTPWKLLDMVPRCRRALLAAAAETPLDGRLGSHWQALGVEVEQVSLPGTVEMLVEPHRGQVPHAAIGHIAGWLGRQILEESPAPLSIEPAAIESSGARTLSWRGSIREQIFRTSEPELFGIVSEPDLLNDDLPTVVLLNSGSAYRIAASRLNVLLARELAAAGFRTLRLDLSGLGDSVAADAAAENDPYPATAFRDVEIAMRELKARYGARRCVLVGLCSGAYAAFQAAVQLPGPLLAESILINPLTFFWKDGMSLDAPSIEQMLQQHRCLARVLDPAKLLKFLAGRTQVGWSEAARIVARRLLRTIPSRHGEHQELDGPATGCEIGHPRRDDLPGDLLRVAGQGRSLAMFFATTDPGYSILTYDARRQANRLRRSGKLHVEFIKGADHTFSRRGPRSELIASLTAYLRRRYRDRYEPRP